MLYNLCSKFGYQKRTKALWNIPKKKKLANWVSEWVRVTVTRELQFLIRYPFKEFVHLMATKSLSSLLSISSSSSLRSLGINATTFHYVFMHLLTLFFFWQKIIGCFIFHVLSWICWFTLFLIAEGLAFKFLTIFVCILILFSFIVVSYSGFSDLVIFTAKKW